MEENEGKNPNWGGARPGAGRRSTVFKLTQEEARLLLRFVQSVKRNSPVGELIERLRKFAERK